MRRGERHSVRFRVRGGFDHYGATGPKNIININIMYAIQTIHGGQTVHAQDWNYGKDGFVHGVNGTATVASIPRENVEGVFAR